MNIKTAYSAGRLTICLEGELDHHAARDCLRGVIELIDEYLPRQCVLDLAELRFMDSSGIALIVRAAGKMREIGGTIWIENPSGQAKRVLDCAGVERLLRVATIGG